MLLVLDNTVMSNFALVGRTDWLRQVWPNMLVTTEEAWTELLAGERLGRLPSTDWTWLSILSLTDIERDMMARLVPRLGLGEASCLAIAIHRGYAVLTDDQVARREARRLGVPLSGTIGALNILAQTGVITIDAADKVLLKMIELGFRSPVLSLSDLN